MVVDWSTGLTVGGVLVALGGMVVGFLGHELVHVGVLSAFGRRPSIELDAPRLVFAAVPPADTPRWINAIALLAPVGWAAVGLWAIWPILSMPLSLDGVLLLGGFAVGALPSPADIFVLLLYRPDAPASEVAADG